MALFALVPIGHLTPAHLIGQVNDRILCTKDLQNRNRGIVYAAGSIMIHLKQYVGSTSRTCHVVIIIAGNDLRLIHTACGLSHIYQRLKHIIDRGSTNISIEVIIQVLELISNAAEHRAALQGTAKGTALDGGGALF